MEIRRLRGRRAEANEEIMWLIGETLLVLVFAAAVFYWLISLQNDTLLEKNYLSRDLGLLIDSVYASPGNVEYEYSTNVVNITKFNFFFKDQTVSTVEIGSEQAVQYWYADDKISNSFIDSEARSPESIKLCNSQGIVSIGREKCTDTALTCPVIDTALSHKPKIFLNPVFGGDEKGAENTDAGVSESEITRKIAQSLQKLDATANHFEFLSTRDLDHDLLPPPPNIPIGERANMMTNKNYDAWITISVGDYSDGKNPVVAYSPKYDLTKEADRDKKNEKLGCIVENMLIGNNQEITSVSPVIKQENDPLLSPSNDAVAINLEIGNIQFPYSSVISNPEQTAAIIYAGLMDYYGIKQTP